MPQRITRGNVLPVVQLEIDRTGKIHTEMTDLHRDATISNTLLEALYPGIRVATVDVPREPLSDYEQNQVAQTLAHLEFEGVRYALAGASSSAKEGKFYAVEAGYERAVAERFQNCSEAAVVYFGILVGPCKSRIELPECRVMVVDDPELGTNDCRGWIKRSLFGKLNLPPGRFYQFRLAFAKTQAKGGFKVMEDDVAELVEADIILPSSSLKPAYIGPSRLSRWIHGSAKVFDGPVVLGIREVSRDLAFRSSYTLIEHAPPESLEEEIAPRAREQAGKLKAAVDGGDMDELLGILGTAEAQKEVLEGESVAPDPGYTSVENTILEAVLKADGSGSLVRFPWVQTQLQRRLASWAFKASTAGALSFPAFALADDGFLVASDGEVYCSADWMPKEAACTRLACRDLLVVRYPIRTKEDLLPLFNLGTSELTSLLTQRLKDRGCPMREAEIVDQIVMRQLRLEGTLLLHSETAKRNGGDYDFDTICVVEGDRFPKFVADRFGYQERLDNQKKKLPKKRSPWFTLPYVALQAKGNQIGSITDLKTSCLAAGRPDLAEQLAVELQAALDQLKHGTRPNWEVLKSVRGEVPKAPWLDAKTAERVADLPQTLEVLPTDGIGRLYNSIRPLIEELFREQRTISDFRGLVMTGKHYPERYYDEALKLCRMYAARVGEITAKRDKLEQAVKEAEAALEAVKDDRRERSKAGFRLGQAKSTLHSWEKSRKEIKALISQIQKWGETRKGDRRLWLQALFDAASKGSGNGSVCFYAFPQEMVDAIAERTGGRRVVVAMPELCDGEVEVDAEGRVYLVGDPDGSGALAKRLLYEGQVTTEGDVLRDFGRSGQPVAVGKVHPFPIVPGRGEVRDGKVYFPGTVQRPQVHSKTRGQAKHV